MSKITFRADDDLVRRLEEFDASKSEVMREALRTYLDDVERDDPAPSDGASGTVDRQRETGLRELELPDVNVNVSLDGIADDTASVEVDRESSATERKTPDRSEQRDRDHACNQCGEAMDADYVYCPNCGEKANHRVFCECGDEVRSDWAFCPGCGRRTTAADVLDRS